MWRLNPHHGAVMEPQEYVDSVRLRLGCAGPCEPVACAACQNGSLDMGASHATCCAVGEATRGHNAVATLVHAAAQSCDCTAEMDFLFSSLALTCGPRMFSPLPWATPTLPLTSRSAPRTLSKPAQTARRPDTRPNLRTVVSIFLRFPPEHLLHPNCVECLWAPRYVDCFALFQ